MTKYLIWGDIHSTYADLGCFQTTPLPISVRSFNIWLKPTLPDCVRICVLPLISLEICRIFNSCKTQMFCCHINYKE